MLIEYEDKIEIFFRILNKIKLLILYNKVVINMMYLLQLYYLKKLVEVLK